MYRRGILYLTMAIWSSARYINYRRRIGFHIRQRQFAHRHPENPPRKCRIIVIDCTHKNTVARTIGIIG